MKIYSVEPGSQVLKCSDGREIRATDPIAWGDSSPAAANLCNLILRDVFDDARVAANLTQRFKWRTVVTWNKDQPRAMTEDEVRAVVADIDRVAAERAPMIARQQRERPQLVSDRPSGEQHYRSNPELRPNKPL